jgi:hypothetical protein
MITLKITDGIKADVSLRDLWARASNPKEPEFMAVYNLIYETKSNRKDGSISIQVSDLELQELYNEADFSSDPLGAVDPSAGYLKSWAALKNQINKVRMVG